MNILGVTYPTPCDVVMLKAIFEARPEDRGRAFLLQSNVHAGVYPFKDGHQSDHYKKGPERPFIGHRTKQMISLPDYELKHVSIGMQRVRKVVEVFIQTRREGSNIDEIIQFVLSGLTNLTLQTLLPYAPRKTHGTTMHRMRTRTFVDMVSPNESVNRYTLVSGHSNAHETLVGDDKDSSINFLSLLCFQVEHHSLGASICRTPHISQVYIIYGRN